MKKTVTAIKDCETGLARDEEGKTEFTRIRESFNLTKAEVAREIGISLPVYSLKERGKRRTTQEGLMKFERDIWVACTNIVNRKKRDSENLGVNTYFKVRSFDTVEEEIKDELSLNLVFPQITEKIYKGLLRELMKGKTIIQVCVRAGVDELELCKLLKRDGLEFEMGDKNLIN